MSHQIVMLSGKQGSGKSTAQSEIMVSAKLAGFDYVHLFNFADALYRLHNEVLNVLAHEYGIPQTTKKDGVLLQLLGTEWGRKVYGPNIWVNIVANRIEKLANQPGKHLVVIADCRFKNEFDAFPMAVRVRLEAPEDIRKPRTQSWRENTNHPSETDLDEYSDQGKFDLNFQTHNCHAPHYIAACVFARLNVLEVLP